MPATGCAWLLPSESVERVANVHTEAFARSLPIASSVESVFSVEVEGLVAHVRAYRQERCLVESGRRIERVRLRSQRSSPWAWLWSATEVAAAGSLATLAQGGWQTAGWVLAVPAAVDLAVLAHRAGQQDTETLPATEQLDHSEAVPCQREPQRNLTIHWRGDRGQTETTTDSAGRSDLALSTLPRQTFPYQWPLATATCNGCNPQPVAPTADDAATLVLARRELDDFDSWLLLHPDTMRASEVQRGRAQAVAKLKGEQDALLATAKSARASGDWIRAAAVARQCEQLCRLPAPACTALYGEIVDAFVLQQRTLALAAAARGDLPAVEAAHYRCQLMDPLRPACRHIEAAAQELRLAPVLQRVEVALKLRDFAAARTALAQCQAIAPGAAQCADGRARVDLVESQWRWDQAASAAQAGSKAWGKRQRAAACARAEQCRSLAPLQPRCAKLVQRCQAAGLLGPLP